MHGSLAYKDRWTQKILRWKKKENADETSEVGTQSGSTQTNPTFSREDLGAAVSEYKDRVNSEKTNTKDWQRYANQAIFARKRETVKQLPRNNLGNCGTLRVATQLKL